MLGCSHFTTCHLCSRTFSSAESMSTVHDSMDVVGIPKNGAVLGTNPDGTPISAHATFAVPTEPSRDPQAAVTREAERLPETLHDIPAQDREVKAAIDGLLHDDVAPKDIRAPGANSLPLDHLIGVPYHPDRPMLNQVPKEDVWNLIRLFDKQVNHVTVVPRISPGQLDLQTACDDEFAPEGMRMHLERGYKLMIKSKPVLMASIEPYQSSRPITIFYALRAAVLHLSAIATWRNRRRTAALGAGYFLAWSLHLLLFTCFALLLALIVHPPARTFLFPALPKLVGPLPYADSEKVIDRIAPTAAAATDKIAETVDLDPGIQQSVPGTKEILADEEEHDTQIWQQVKPIAQALALIADTWERFANALSPTLPFPTDAPRRRLAFVLTPVLLVAPFITPALIVRTLTFMLGAAFFGWPVLSAGGVRSIQYMNAVHPRWTEMLDLRHTLLRGVPTNAQLTLTLLRVAEAQHAPIPPPPPGVPGPGDDPFADKFSADETSSDEYDEDDESDEQDTPTGADDLVTTDLLHTRYQAEEEAQEQQASAATAAIAAETGDGPSKKARAASVGRGLIARALRKTARVTGKTVERARHGRAALRDHAPGKEKGGATVRDGYATVPGSGAGVAGADATVNTKARPANDGPNSFSARHRGRKGHVVIADGGFTFRPGTRSSRARALLPGSNALAGDGATGEDADGDPTAAFQLADVVEVRKVGGAGAPRQLLAAAAQSGGHNDDEGGGGGGRGNGLGGGHGLPGGLAVRDRWGREEAFTTLSRRDELFDRIVAAAPVRWAVASAWE